MILPLWYRDNSDINFVCSIGLFCQRMLNRLIVGAIRYKQLKSNKKMLTRLKAEVKAYEETGNKEHLVNAANYCFLEYEYPEKLGTFWKENNYSVTRDILNL